jgi:amino acid efflux transporter
MTFTGVVLLAALAAGLSNADDLIRATSACFLAVYLLALASAARILSGGVRAAALAAFTAVAVVTVFSKWFLLVPLVAALACVVRVRSLAAFSLRGPRAPRP